MKKISVLINLGICLLLLISSCKKPGPTESVRNFPATNFNRLESAGLLNIQVMRSNSFSVIAEGNARDINKLKAEVINGRLKIGYIDVQPNIASKVIITMPVLDEFDFSDRVQATISGFTQASEVEGRLNEFAKATIQMNVSQFTAEAKNNSELTLKGQAEKVYVAAEENSLVNAYDIASVFGRALAYKNSTIKIQVSHTLNASATDKSTIYFKGNPQNRFTSELGNSQIIEE